MPVVAEAIPVLLNVPMCAASVVVPAVRPVLLELNRAAVVPSPNSHPVQADVMVVVTRATTASMMEFAGRQLTPVVVVVDPVLRVVAPKFVSQPVAVLVSAEPKLPSTICGEVKIGLVRVLFVRMSVVAAPTTVSALPPLLHCFKRCAEESPHIKSWLDEQPAALPSVKFSEVPAANPSCAPELMVMFPLIVLMD